MRTRVLALAIGGLLLVSAATAQDPAKKDKDPAVRLLDLKGFKASPPKGEVFKPTTITKAEELPKSFDKKEWQESIAKRVDFGKEQLLFFYWSGPSQDRLDFRTEDAKGKTVVVFLYSPGFLEDLAGHWRLYALPKDATWRVEKK